MSAATQITDLPPETLLEIFSIILYTPIFETVLHGATYVGYLDCHNFVVAARDWKRVEAVRGILRRVCKLWDELVAEFAGRFVFVSSEGSLNVSRSCKSLVFCNNGAPPTFDQLVHLAAKQKQEGCPFRIRILYVNDSQGQTEIHLYLADITSLLPCLGSLHLSSNRDPDDPPSFAFDTISRNLPLFKSLCINVAFSALSPPLILPHLEVLLVQLPPEEGWNFPEWSVPLLRILSIIPRTFEELDLALWEHILSRVETLNAPCRLKRCDPTEIVPRLTEVGIWDNLPFEHTNIAEDHPLRHVVYTIESHNLRLIPFTLVYSLHLRGIKVTFKRVSFMSLPDHRLNEDAPWAAWRGAMEVCLPPGGGIYDKAGLSLDFRVNAHRIVSHLFSMTACSANDLGSQ